MRLSRRVVAAAAVVVALVPGPVALASACRPPDGALVALDPDSGAPGTRVTVHGESWEPDEDVVLVWNSTGQALASTPASSGRFQTDLVIPDAPTGMHYVEARQNRHRSTVAFEVTESSTGARALPPTAS